MKYLMILDLLLIFLLQLLFFIGIMVTLFSYLLWRMDYENLKLKFISNISTTGSLCIYIINFPIFYFFKDINNYLMGAVSLVFIFMTIILNIIILTTSNHSEEINKDLREEYNEIDDVSNKEMEINEESRKILIFDEDSSEDIIQDADSVSEMNDLDKFEFEELYLSIKEKNLENDKNKREIDTMLQLQDMVDKIYKRESKE